MIIGLENLCSILDYLLEAYCKVLDHYINLNPISRYSLIQFLAHIFNNPLF